MPKKDDQALNEHGLDPTKARTRLSDKPVISVTRDEQTKGVRVNLLFHFDPEHIGEKRTFTLFYHVGLAMHAALEPAEVHGFFRQLNEARRRLQESGASASTSTTRSRSKTKKSGGVK